MARRREIRQAYRELFLDVPGVAVFDGGDDRADNCWLTSIVVDDDAGWTAGELMAYLDSRGIESRPMWKPMHLQPVFAQLPGLRERQLRMAVRARAHPAQRLGDERRRPAARARVRAVLPGRAVTSQPAPRPLGRYDVVKRSIDVIVAVVASGRLRRRCKPCLPLLVARKLGRPVLFRQQRPGLHGEPFTLIKFRTMREPDPTAGLVSDADRTDPLRRALAEHQPRRVTNLLERPTRRHEPGRAASVA